MNDIQAAYSDPNFNFQALPIEKSLNLALGCKWLIIEDGTILIGTPGKKIIQALDDVNGEINAGRVQLLEYIKTERPYWVETLKNGRSRSMTYLPDNIVDIFSQLELYSPSSTIDDEDTILWWDRIVQSIYDSQNRKNAFIGRLGERLTYKYEYERTGRYPVWVALEDNKAGYDILSLQSRQDERLLCIEVKTTTSPYPYFFLTKNEWVVSESKGNDEYLIYFWDISNRDEVILTIYDSKILINHVPKDVGVGEWVNSKYQISKLPSSSFKDRHEFNDLSEIIFKYLSMVNE